MDPASQKDLLWRNGNPQWYPDSFSIREVIGHFEHSLPVIVKLEASESGTANEYFHKHDMFYITEVRYQERVAVKTELLYDDTSSEHQSGALAESRNVTIVTLPIDCQLKFNVLGQEDYYEPPKPLLEIQKEGQLTLGVKLRPDSNNRAVLKMNKGNRREKIMLQDIAVNHFYSQPYLIGFVLPYWNAPSDQTEIFPACLDLTFRVLQSFSGETKAYFLMYKKELWDKCREFEHSKKKFGLTDIVLYSDELNGENPYDFPEPADYFRFKDFVSGIPIADRIPPNDAQSSPTPCKPVKPLSVPSQYLTAEDQPKTRSAEPRQKIRGAPANTIYGNEYADAYDRLPEEDKHKPCRADTRQKNHVDPANTIYEDVYADAYSIVQQDVPKEDKPKARLADTRQKNRGAPVNTISEAEYADAYDIVHEDVPKVTIWVDCQEDKPKARLADTRQKNRGAPVNTISEDEYADAYDIVHEDVPKGARPKTNLRQAQSRTSCLNSGVKSQRSCNDSSKYLQPRKITGQSNVEEMAYEDVDFPSVHCKDTSQVVPIKPCSSQANTGSDCQGKETKICSSCNTVYKDGEVQGKQSTANEAFVKKDFDERDNIYYDESNAYASLAEVPLDISPLDVAQIGGCLKHMKLEKYVKIFEDKFIDGTILKNTPIEELVKEIGMTPTEASKLSCFAHKQWRPKIKREKEEAYTEITNF